MKMEMSMETGVSRHKAGLRSRITSGVRAWWRCRRDIAQLQGLGDHILKDMGLNHHDIDRLRRSQW